MQIIELKKTEGKAQSAVEMVTTYSWAILILSLFIAIVFVLTGNTTGLPQVPATCSIQSLLPCQDSVITNYSSKSSILYYIYFINNFQNPIEFPSNAFNVITTGIGINGQKATLGDCNPRFALSGSPVICLARISGKISPPTGTKVDTFFTIAYDLCQGNSQQSCSGFTSTAQNGVSQTSYQTSGYATQSVAPADIRFYSITTNAEEENGYTKALVGTNALIYINGIPYATGQNAIFVTTGNYQISGSVPPGFMFSTWSSNTAVSKVLSSNSLTTNINIQSNVTLSLISTSLQCYVCSASAPEICPSTCPNIVSTLVYPNGQGTYTCPTGQGCSR